MTNLILAVALAAGAAAAPETAPAQGGLLNLSCMEALAAIGQPNLAGVFSFIPEKDSPAAFADLIVHEPKSLAKFLTKLDEDFQAAGGVTEWDHEALMYALTLYSGPLGPTLPKPAPKALARINELSLAPKVSLEQLSARRKK